MVAANTFWCFLLPTVLVIGTAVGGHVDTSDELNEQEFKKACPPKEHWDKCHVICQRTCANRNENPGLCPVDCQGGCVCDTGLVRGPEGRCIKPKECPDAGCPPGEHFDKCNFACQRNCSNWNDTVIPCLAICLPGCLCDKGTVRSSLPFGKCIKTEECKKTDEEGKNFCPKNEVYAACRGHCELDCSTRNETIPEYCDKPERYCISSCICLPGYVRGPKGTCIKSDECPAKDDTEYPVKRVCPENEIWSGFAHCQTNCTSPRPRPCPKIVMEGCICTRGYQRGLDGKCIPREKCPQRYGTYKGESKKENFCPKNEVYAACRGRCELSCKWKNGTIGKDCGEPARYCISSCICLPGYVRGPKGTCIKPDDCPADDDTKYPVERVCPENEKWSGVAHCQTNCTHPKRRACPRIIVEGCVCKDEYQRGLDGKCIPRNQCPKIPESFCPKNEVYAACRGFCELDCRTRNRTLPERCFDHLYCVSSCICVSGYVRGPNGTCIRPGRCPADDDTKYPVERVCPENEIWSGIAHCQTNCTHSKPRGCPRKIVNGCVCKKDYQRGLDGKCIPKKECPKLLESFCPKNEVYAACKGPCELDCRTRNRTLPEGCFDDIYCVSSCICVSGYVRGPKGTCIRPDRCPADDDTNYPVERVCPENEIWSGRAHCQTNCTHSKPRGCPRMIIEGCVCKEGYQRGLDGKCIPKKECPKLPDAIPNQFWCRNNEEMKPCPSLCPDNCTNYEDKNRKCKKACLPIPGCVCKQWYVRGPQGNCIKYDKCPREKRPEDCTELEYYDTCGTSCEDNCENYKQEDKTCDKKCNVGCFCQPGYIRGPEGDCIWPFDCPNKSPIFDDNENNRLDGLSTETEAHDEVDTEEFVDEPLRTHGCPNIIKCIMFCKSLDFGGGLCRDDGTCVCFGR